MNRIVTVAIILGAFGCSSMYQPYSETARITTDAQRSFDCSVATLNSFGYTLLDANRDAGFVKAHRQRKQAFLQIDVWFDEITSSVFKDPSGVLLMRGVGGTVSGNTINETSGDVRGDVQKLLASCAKGL